MLVNLLPVFERISSSEHVSAKCYGGRHGKAVRTHWSRSGRDPCTLERVVCTQNCFFGGSGKYYFPGFLHEASFHFHTYVRFFVFFARSATQTADNFACPALGAQTTATDNKSSSAESVLHPACYNAARSAVLLTVAFVGPWDPSSRIELGHVSYCLLRVICETGAVLCCCCALPLL